MQTKQAVEEIKALVASDNRINTSIFADDLSEYQAYFITPKLLLQQ